MSSVGDDDWPDEEIQGQKATIISLGSLPPHIGGPVYGYVRLTVELSTPDVEMGNIGEWLVRVRWWGSMSTLGKGDLLREKQELCFPIHVPRDSFGRYLEDMADLQFDVVDKQSHRVCGQANAAINLDELESVGGTRKHIVVLKTNSTERHGTLSFHASLVWGDLSTATSPVVPQQGDVKVWKNMDFPPNLPSFNTFNVQRPVDNLRVEHNNVIEKLVQKAEALKRAMEKALDVQENRPSNDIQTILATAKSFGPVDTVDSVTQIYPRKMLETESTPQITEMPRPSPPPVYAKEAVKRIPLEMLLCVDAIKLKVSNAKSSANVYIQHKALFTTTSLMSPWKKVSEFTRKVPFTYSISQPFELNGSTLVFLKTKPMILEVWMKQSTESHLVGLAKLRLSCFAHLLHNKAISEIQAGEDPFASKVYDNVVIKNPFDGSTMGLMACSIWIGDATQIRTIQLKQFEAQRIQAWWRGCNARRKNPLPHCRKDDLKFTEEAQQVDLDTINNIEAERDSFNKPTDQDASKRNELKFKVPFVDLKNN
ncbi:unnamed protein product [Aphanomyces euteiches]